MNNPNHSPLIGPWREILESVELRGIFNPSTDHRLMSFGEIERIIEESPSTFQIWISRRAWEKFRKTANLIWQHELYPVTVQKIVMTKVKEWILEETELTNQSILKTTLQSLLEDIQTSFQDKLILVPIKGLILPNGFSYKYGHWELLPNDNNSLLRLTSLAAQKRFALRVDVVNQIQKVDTADSFIAYKYTGQYKRGFHNAFVQATDIVEILRLFLGSNYADINDGMPSFAMGVIGGMAEFDHLTLLELNGHTLEEVDVPGFQSSERIIHKISADITLFKKMEFYGLHKLFDTFAFVKSPRAEKSKNSSEYRNMFRVFRCVTWFAKGTRSLSRDDSYLNYAIAIESLLSTHESHPQSTFAKQMAALLADTDEDWYVLPDKRKKIKRATGMAIRGTKSKREYYYEEKKELEELLEIRSKIVHGKGIFTESEVQILAYYEEIVRNVILLYLKGGWESLDAFERWRNIHYPDQEQPIGRIRNNLRKVVDDMQSIINDISDIT